MLGPYAVSISVVEAPCMISAQEKQNMPTVQTRRISEKPNREGKGILSPVIGFNVNNDMEQG